MYPSDKQHLVLGVADLVEAEPLLFVANLLFTQRCDWTEDCRNFAPRSASPIRRQGWTFFSSESPDFLLNTLLFGASWLPAP